MHLVDERRGATVWHRHDVAYPRAVSDLAQRLVDNTASLHSINRLTAFLQSLGHRNDRDPR